MLSALALLVSAIPSPPKIDDILARPYTPEVPFGSSGDRLWATSPQGWGFTEGVNFLYLTNTSVFGVTIRSGSTFYRVGSADYFPSHIHMHGKAGPPEMTATASFTFSGDSTANPLTEPFKPEKRWTCWSSGHRTDWYIVDLGAKRSVRGVDLWFFDDRPKGECAPPESVLIERRVGEVWEAVATDPAAPQKGRTDFQFRAPVEAEALRFTFRNLGEKLYTGLYGVKPNLGAPDSSGAGTLHVEGDKWITRDDVLVSTITLANRTRKRQPYDVSMRPDERSRRGVDVDGYRLATRFGAADERDGSGFSFRFTGVLAPGETKRINFGCGVATTEEQAALRLIDWIDAKDPLADQVKQYQVWFTNNAPSFVCSDPLVTKMFYHRLYNLKKNSMNPRLGRLNHRAFSEGRWRSGWYSNVISYGAGHQIRESRWLRDPSYAWGHLQTFTENPRPDGIYPSHVTPKGQQGGRYTDWITASAWDAYLVHPDKHLLASVLPAMIANAEGWRKVYGWGGSPLLVVDDHWWTGMEWQPSFFSFNGYKTDREDPLRRVDLTAYNYGNETAVANACRVLGDSRAPDFAARAAETKAAVQKQMWNPETNWFHSLRASDGAMSPAKEIIGIYPFAFDLPDARFVSAWQTLLDPNLFWTKWPLASASKDCPAFAQNGWPMGPGGRGCMWNGPSWPHANGLAMTAMENTLRRFRPPFPLPDDRAGRGKRQGMGVHLPLTKDDFYNLFMSFTKVQYVNGQPWTGEFYNGDTGEWKTRERDYNHSIWLDPLIGGLVGIVPRSDDVLEIDPLLPEGKWSYWKLDNQWYHGHRLTVAFQNRRFTVAVDGRRVFSAAKPTHLTLTLARHNATN